MVISATGRDWHGIVGYPTIADVTMDRLALH
jgi:hypothetical protein